jgi:N-acetylmuramoyl-L-alanine amidase
LNSGSLPASFAGVWSNTTYVFNLTAKSIAYPAGYCIIQKLVQGMKAMRFLRLTVGFCMLAFATVLAAQTVSVNEVRISEGSDRTRIVLDLDRSARHQLFTLANPDRVVIDIQHGSFALGANRFPAGLGQVAKLRGANRDDGTARLVLDLDGAVQPTSFLLEPGGGKGYRLVIDLLSASKTPMIAQVPAASAAPATPVAPAASPPSVAQKLTPATMSAATPAVAPQAAPKVVKKAPAEEGDRTVVVAIDPGHGGKDPGAHGRGGLQEKKAVLQIGKRLAELVNAEPGMRAFMTRSDDRFLSLKERRDVAARAGADLFVSVHADACDDRRVGGSTIYVLSEKGATDEAARLLAQRENSADLLGNVALNDKDAMLASVLVDLSQNASLEASIAVGDLFINEMGKVSKVRKRQVQQAGFMVLKLPDIPSLLVETAYISNPKEESNLQSVQFQQRLAKAMHSGIRSYFYSNPPPGTRIAKLSHERSREQRLAQQHVIRNGDTLSGIAQYYNVSVARIRSTNSINGNEIKVGQVLRIPPALDI